MKQYTSEFKIKLINKFLNSSNISITDFAKENNVNYITFKKWLDKYEGNEMDLDFKEAVIEDPVQETNPEILFNLNTMEMKLTMEQAVELIKRYGRL